MSFKKVGIAQDSNLRGDSVRVQNPDNTLAYSEFVYDGSATMSYTLPSSAGTSGQVLQISSGTTLVWSSAVGPQGPIGPTGLPGSSGSSGTSGSSGSSGATGTSGSSGSSGANGSQGPAGSSGSSGSSGQNGTSGTSGVSAVVQSYNTSGGFVNVTFLDENGTTLVPIPVGADGTSGSSGSSGQDGVNGAAGSSGSSGSSGANGVGNATISGDVNYVPKYIGATALGTASMLSVGEQIQILDGLVGTPSFAFVNDPDSGIYRIGPNDYAFATNGAQKFRIADVALINSVPLRIPDGTLASPSLIFSNDLDTGFYRTTANEILVALGGSRRFIMASSVISTDGIPFRAGLNGTNTNPAYIFVNGQNSGLYYVSGATPQVALSVQSVTASVFGQTNSTIFSNGVPNTRFGLTNSVGNQTFFDKAVNHTPVTAVATASYVMDMSQSNVFLLTLTASTTLDYTNAQIGSYVIVATQNATGNYSMNLASGKFQGATWSGVATASNAKTIIQVIYDGSKGIITSQKITDL